VVLNNDLKRFFDALTRFFDALTRFFDALTRFCDAEQCLNEIFGVK
jgi:hypothetical protein